MIVGMIDAQCERCRKRFSWTGTILDRPSCPRCGHRVPRERLEADQRRQDRFAGLMALPAAASLARCQAAGCGAELLFVKTAKSGGARTMPVSPDPHPQGNVRLAAGGAVVLAGEDLQAARA